MKFQIRLKDEHSRLFRTLYKGRYRVAKKTVWYFADGFEKHQLVLTSTSNIQVYKKWTWVTDGEGKMVLFKGHRKPIVNLRGRRVERFLNSEPGELE